MGGRKVKQQPHVLRSTRKTQERNAASTRKGTKPEPPRKEGTSARKNVKNDTKSTSSNKSANTAHLGPAAQRFVFRLVAFLHKKKMKLAHLFKDKSFNLS